MAEGIVPGAGLALLRAIEAVEKDAATLEGDERAGALILRRTLEAPARQIADNSAVDHARAKNPRSSSNRSGSMRYTPLSFVSLAIISY